MELSKVKQLAIYGLSGCVGFACILISAWSNKSTWDIVKYDFLENLGFAILAALIMVILTNYINKAKPRFDKYTTTLKQFEHSIKIAREIKMYNTWISQHWARLIEDSYNENSANITLILGSFKENSFTYTRLRHTEHRFNIKITSPNVKIKSSNIDTINAMKHQTRLVIGILTSSHNTKEKAPIKLKFFTGFSPAFIARVDSNIYWSISPVDKWNMLPENLNIYSANIKDPKGAYWLNQLDIIEAGLIGNNIMTHNLAEEKKYLLKN